MQKKFDSLFSLPENIKEKVCFDLDAIENCLKENEEYLIVNCENKTGLLKKSYMDISQSTTGLQCIGFLPSFKSDDFGSKEFLEDYNVKYPYMGGSMANEISSADMVIAFAKAGYLCSLGTGGLPIDRIESQILKIKEAIPSLPFCCNILNAPQEPAKEQILIDMYMKYGINVIEASAFMNLSNPLVYYRLKGLSKNADGTININNKIIAKISRDKIAKRFMEPAPQKIVKKLLEQNLITEEQAEISKFVPMADDITAESDSGGHTDNRQFTSLYTVIKNLRDEIQKTYNYAKKIRVGIGGGIGTPESMLAAFEMGADYVVTGSINQSCQEAGTSDWVKQVLAEAEYTDVDMAPAADMFELGAKVQVLKKGTMYSMRAKNLFDIYKTYNSIEDIPQDEREKLEVQYFQKPLNQVWAETKEFFQKINNTDYIEKAEQDPKKKMALIFRWYLGQSPNWGRRAVMERKLDFQIWCGPSLGAFNDWVKNTEFSKPENRFVAKLADLLFKETVFLKRKNVLRDFYKIFK